MSIPNSTSDPSRAPRPLRAFAESLATPSFNALLARINEGRALSLSGLAGSLKAFVAARIFLATQSPMLVVCPQSIAAEKTEADLAAILGEETVCPFPDYDTLPGGKEAPHNRIVEDRLRACDRLAGNAPCVVVTTARSLVQKTLPPGLFARRALDISLHEVMGLDSLVEWLTNKGFARTPIIEDIGQFSVRGGIVDIFPFLADNPLRLEFWGDTVESIRTFDVFSQRSVAKLETVRIVPMVETVAENEASASILAHLRPGSFVLLDETGAPGHLCGAVAAELREAWTQAGCAHREDLLCAAPEIAALLAGHRLLTINPFVQDTDFSFGARPAHTAQGGTAFFTDFRLLLQNGYTITVLCENSGQQNRFNELAAEADVHVTTVIGNVDEGFILPNDKTAVFTENRLFNRYMHRLKFRKWKGGTTIHHVSALKKGDIVVHLEHGIGRFMGLERIRVGALEKDCVTIEYQDRASVSVPIEDLHKVQKYSVTDDAPAPELSALGGKTWEKTKSRTKAELDRIIRELVELYATRKDTTRPAYPADSVWQKEFEESFIYDDTPDQVACSADIKTDLQRSHPMERLLCGDVGFGKTEVAMRAAFKVVEAGKQVAVLTPTTILAFQHFSSFSERFRDYPVRMGMVSRFVSADETRATLEKCAAGEIDIIIGTHRLLSKDIAYKDLGLLVIDEEHRFGVKQKEKIKGLRTQVDVLSMTATPIPRTLQMSLMGIRDLSLITTPPLNRLPIHTRVVEADKKTIRDAILREKARNGQVFYVHNRVNSIGLVEESLRDLVPHLTLAVAHGQQSESELSEAMRSFIEGKSDILICSAIIESGLDIPNVNTIIVDRADHFGLSQLYQLRGRVGRSSVQAYAYLMVNDFNRITPEAKQRLKALEQFTELGSGYQIAMRDLEIRGAGNLLGTRQHGLISMVGFEMYNTLLNESIQEIREKKKIVHSDPVLRIEARAFIPDEYIPETSQRLEIYHRLSRAASIEEIESMAPELEDRFGPVPETVHTLLNIIAVKFCASIVNASAVSVTARELKLDFSLSGETGKSATEIGALIKKFPSQAVVCYGDPLSIALPLSATDPVAEAKKVLIKIL